MATETVHLRRRIQVLERAHTAPAEESKTTLDDPFEDSLHETRGVRPVSFPVDYQSDSDSTGVGPAFDDSKVDNHVLSTPPPSEAPNRRGSDPRQDEASSRAWYEFDLSVVVALISPIGNWLTGGDHVKNVLLLLLLIFYLHQIIELPWTLYNLSRPRRTARPQPPGSSTAEDRFKASAASELRFFELFFLTFTVLSPFIGAFVLRYITSTVLDTDVISWFSTGLFILATGIRPLKHVVERVQERVTDLHDVIHYPPPSMAVEENTQALLMNATRRITELEKVAKILEAKIAEIHDDIHDCLDSVDGVENFVQQSDKDHDSARTSQEMRLAALEAAIDSFRKGKGAATTGYQLSGRSSKQSRDSIIDWVLSLISYITGAPTQYPTSPQISTSPMSPKSPTSSLRSLRSRRRTFPSSRLETIPEDVDYAYPNRASRIVHSTPKSRYLLRIPGVNLALRCGDLATLPFRAVVHYLLSTRLGSSFNVSS